jgi:hypothetical protein
MIIKIIILLFPLEGRYFNRRMQKQQRHLTAFVFNRQHLLNRLGQSPFRLKLPTIDFAEHYVFADVFSTTVLFNGVNNSRCMYIYR